MVKKETLNTILILIAVIFIGGFFRFYKLDWGEGLFTHPDEYHIVISANQLSFPTQMNPNFFNYGTVTIYLIYFTKQLSAISYQLSDLNPFLIGRFYSALFSTLSILLVYKIGQRFLSSRYSLLAAALVALTPGLIQQAHFATPESALIFFLLASLFFLIKFIQTTNYQLLTTNLTLASVFLGLALGVKSSGAVFLGVFFIALLVKSKFSPTKIFLPFILSLFITTVTLFIVDPYIFLDFRHFYSSFSYESSLARGTIPVFYTRQFIDTIPVLFQLEKIYPFTLGLPLLLFGTTGLMWMVVSSLKDKKSRSLFLILYSAFLILFLPNAFLFAKWTRFISPTFPFFALFSAFFLYKLSQLKIHKLFPLILNSTFLILNFLLLLSFFSIYLTPDVRQTASAWIQNNVPSGSTFLIEEGNMVNVPIKGNFQRLTANFYNFEEDQKVQSFVTANLATTDYIVLGSRRIFFNHQRLPEQFPKTAQFYDLLFSGRLGFTQIKEFNSFPRIGKLEFPDEEAEETWSVFDHPVIRVFQKTQQLTTEKYSRLLGD